MLLSEWVKAHPEYQVIFKPHPRSRAMYWEKLAEKYCNVEVLAGNYSLAEALRRCSIVVNIMSNAVIEAALAQRPIIYVNTEACPDIFEQEDFFGPKVETVADLEKSMDYIQQNYNKAVVSSESFARYHLHCGTKGLDKTVEYLEALKSRQNIPSNALKESL
jgi:CDP-glycerol glycerophosphotransferase (TagB/SpsB family)